MSPNIVTYHSSNAKPHEAWLAYVVLPSGEQWLVRFTGHSELEAKTKAQVLWDKEQKRYAVVNKVDIVNAALAAAAFNRIATVGAEPASCNIDHPGYNFAQSKGQGRGAQFVGKVWVIHQETRELKRIDPNELDSYLGRGYIRGGPRSK